MGFCSNGANVILRDSRRRILVVRQNYDERKWMLPGGGVEHGETFEQAAVREVLEETGITICPRELSLVAKLDQRVKDYETGLIHSGVMRLYEAFGAIALDEFRPNDEISEAAFWWPEEIVARKGEFKIAYVRMVIHHRRYEIGGLCVPVTGSLAEQVEHSLVTHF